MRSQVGELIANIENAPVPSVRATEEVLTTKCAAFSALWNMKTSEINWLSGAMKAVWVAAGTALVAAIVLVIFGNNGAAIASGVGTIVTGAASRWLSKQKKEAESEAMELLERIKKYCPGQKAM